LSLQAPDASRLLAMVSLAQYDTVAAIEDTPAFLVKRTVTGPISEQAAVAQAAYEVLADLFSLRKPIFDVALAQSLQGIASGPALTAGIRAWHRHRRQPWWRCASMTARRTTLRMTAEHWTAVVADGAWFHAGSGPAMGQCHAVRDFERG